MNCDAELVESTQTIRVSGEMVSGTQGQAFILIKKRPDQMLLTIDYGSHEMTFGISDDSVWRRIRAPRQEDQVALIEGEEAKNWLARGRFFDRILYAYIGEGSIIAIEAADWKGDACLKVSTLDADEVLVDVLVDPQSMYPIAELQTLADGSVKQTVFSDYRDIAGMPLPFLLKSFVDDELKSHTRINSAALNIGVFSELFEMPESLILEK